MSSAFWLALLSAARHAASATSGAGPPAATPDINARATVDRVLAELEDQRGRLILAIDDLYELRSLVTAIRTGLEVGLAHPDRARFPGRAALVGAG